MRVLLCFPSIQCFDIVPQGIFSIFTIFPGRRRERRGFLRYMPYGRRRGIRAGMLGGLFGPQTPEPGGFSSWTSAGEIARVRKTNAVRQGLEETCAQAASASGHKKKQGSRRRKKLAFSPCGSPDFSRRLSAAVPESLSDCRSFTGAPQQRHTALHQTH